jgi:hypothetical protein
MDSDENNNNIDEEIPIHELIEEFLNNESDIIYELYTKLNYNFPWLINSSAELLFFICDYIYIYEPQNIKQISHTINFQKFFKEYYDDIYDTLYVINKYFEFNQNKKLRKHKINVRLWAEFLYKLN